MDISRHSSTRRRRLRFSLRTLLILFLLAGVALGVFARRLQSFRQQHAIAVKYQELGGRIYYHQNGLEQLLLQFLSEWLPGEYNGDVKSIDLVETPTTDGDLHDLSEFPRLEYVCVIKSRVTKKGVDWIAESLPKVDVFASKQQK